MITVSNSVHVYKGLCGGCVFVAAKCAEDEITECPYYAVEVGNVAKPDDCPQLYDVPSNPEVYQWLRDMKYQTDDGAQEYIMYFDIDMPKILDDYFKWRVNRHVI